MSYALHCSNIQVELDVEQVKPFYERDDEENSLAILKQDTLEHGEADTLLYYKCDVSAYFLLAK